MQGDQAGAVNPVFTLNRLPWDQAPVPLADEVNRLLGSPVTEHRTQHGGFSQGIASRLLCANGRRAFVKGIETDVDPHARRLYEQEAEVMAWLPDSFPAPALLGVVREEGWLALVLEDAGGPAVSLPWELWQLDAVSDQMVVLTELATPCTIPFLDLWAADLINCDSWASRARDSELVPDELRKRFDELAELENGLARAIEGDTLVHGDLRADNIVIRPDGTVVFVDWAQAAKGAAWLDPLIFSLFAGAQGVADPERFFFRHPHARAADPGKVNSVLAALAGCFVIASERPGPASVRAFQKVEARAALDWLMARLG